MPRLTPFALGLALPLTFASQAALADLTPAEVWNDWKQYLEGFGYGVAATETQNGDNLNVNNITLSFAMPESAGQMTMTVDSIAFNQNSDGSVSIIMPETMPMKMTGNNLAPGEELDMTLTFTQSGHSMIASGSPAEITTVYSADRLQMDMDQTIGTAASPTGDSAKMTFTANGVSNTSTTTIGEMRGYDQKGSIADASYTMSIQSSEDGGQTADINGAMSSVTVEGGGTIPLTLPDNGDMAALLADGFDIKGRIAYASGNATIDAKNPRDGDFRAQTSSQGGALDVAVGDDGLAYGGTQQDLKMTVNVATMPFPIDLAMQETGFNLMIPVKKSDEPQDFGLGITLAGFTMSDMLWGIFDAAGQLPRDPATIKLDVGGKAKVLVDYMIPQSGTDLAQLDGPQASVKALDLNTLLVDAVGAKLEGNGALTINESGPALIPGVGTPVGTLNFALTGGNGLIDKLVAMGLLPQEQAMGARMMMGIFAVPGSAPDTLNSKIDFTQDGQILANGQRIR